MKGTAMGTIFTITYVTLVMEYLKKICAGFYSIKYEAILCRYI